MTVPLTGGERPEAILHADAHPTRDLFIGGQVKAAVLAAAIAPRVVDKFMERYMYWSQTADRPSRSKGDSGLHSHPLLEGLTVG